RLEVVVAPAMRLDQSLISVIAGLRFESATGQRLSSRRSHRRRMALMWPSLRVPSGASFSTLPVGSPHTCHPPDISATQISSMVPGARPRLGGRRRRVRQLEWSNRRIPWFDGYPAMASAGEMSGSVPVDHHAVRAGQDAEDLVGVLFDEGRCRCPTCCS